MKNEFSFDYLLSMQKAVRTKPGLYFGKGGPAAIPDILSGLVDGVFNECGIGSGCHLSVIVSGERHQEFCVEFTKLGRKPAVAVLPDRWNAHGNAAFNPMAYALAFLAAASERCQLSVANRGLSTELALADGQKPKTRTSKTKATQNLRVRFGLHRPTFGCLLPQDFHRLAGILRDQAVLRPGLSIDLRQQKPGIQFSWQYPHGLSSYLQELDHSRFPIHPGQILVSAAKGDMKLELCLRFVHAGVPEFRNWVNFKPTQGGVHLEGFGDALQELFPDPATGCRIVRFVTNPDTAAAVRIPHAFVAAMHLRITDPKYAGPTKDILQGENIREFVRAACTKAIPKQWEALRGLRDKIPQ